MKVRVKDLDLRWSSGFGALDGQNKQKIRNRFGRTNENVKEVFTIWNERAIVIDSL